jgi:putative (di)nucleoside polyphosphate hydrolase
MLVYRADGKLLLGQRINRVKHWQFPQGGVEKRYSLRENVIRELKEELGIPRSKLGKIKKLSATHSYDWKKPPEYAKGRWRGQTQTFWLVEFRGADSDIDLSAYHEPEFKSFRWCSVATVKRLAAKERIAGYLAPLSEAAQVLQKQKAAPTSAGTRVSRSQSARSSKQGKKQGKKRTA